MATLQELETELQYFLDAYAGRIELINKHDEVYQLSTDQTEKDKALQRILTFKRELPVLNAHISRCRESIINYTVGKNG